MRRAEVYYQERLAGKLEELENGYRFIYLPEYVAEPDVRPISLTLPLRVGPYESDRLFPFFSGLLAEGTLRDLQCRQFKIDVGDHFGLLLRTAGHDVIGCVRVVPESSESSLDSSSPGPP